MTERKVKRLTKLRIFEASLVDRGANQHAAVMLFKHADPADDDETTPFTDLECAAMAKALSDGMRATAAELDQAIRDRCDALGKDLMLAWGDPVITQLYQQYLDAPDGPEAMEKAALPGDRLWNSITKAARADQRAGETLPEAINRVLAEDGVYSAYLVEAG